MESTPLLNKLLSNSKVKCSDLTSAQEKLTKIQNDGPNELLILSDFDYTATKAFDENGRRCWPTLGVFEILLNQMKAGLSEELKNVFTRYTPIELDPNLSDEEKTPHMIECWTQLHNIILSSGITKELLKEATNEALIELRDGFKEWVQFLSNQNIPIWLFSTNCGNVIELVLENELGEIPQNISIIANYLEFDQMGKVSHFREPIIHVFNKNTTVIQKGSPFWTAHSEKKNIMLLGDNLGDLNIGQGQEHSGITLKIGFLNTLDEVSARTFLDNFDLVLVEDSTFDIPNLITRLSFLQ